MPTASLSCVAAAAPVGERPFGVYVHWPFCLAKCPYCDFNSHVRERIAHEEWRRAYLAEIDHYAALTPGRTVGSVFFGGGTPSLMEPRTVAAILERIAARWQVAPGCEVTLEANPTSVEAEKFAGFAAAGVNRVSIGVQALNDQDLKRLGRMHNVSEAMDALEIAAKNFTRYSFDLIYARPRQNLKEWREELEKALKIAGAGHLSMYQLTIEPGTAFFTQHARGELRIPDEELAGDFYELTQELTEAAGLPAYEISNHARPGEESRHNLLYWRYGDYAGIGPGAHGRLTLDGRKQATRAHRAPEAWLDLVARQGHGAHDFEEVAAAERVTEALMMGLRLREGVDLRNIAAEGGAPWQEFIAPARIGALAAEGLVAQEGERLRPTLAGMQRLNGVLRYLLEAG
jgi:oxygen-independent coproporphyrinogen-3 oxidase